MGINATAVWRVRPSGSNTNGGGYDAAISGAGTDYSQQNGSQTSGVAGTAAGTAAFSDAGAAFTSAMIGNAIWIASGAGFTVGAYFVTAFTDATHVTLDRSPGTGSAAVWKLGGGWADFWTNTTAALNAVQPGNSIFILGSGTPNPSAYSYDYTVSTSAINLAIGDSTNGAILMAGDPLTPGYKAAPDVTGGMPLVNISNATGGSVFSGSKYVKFQGIWWVTTASAAAPSNFSFNFNYGCVLDQTSFQGRINNGSIGAVVIGCEGFSSTGGTAGGSAVINVASGGSALFNNVHDAILAGIASGGADLYGNIVAKTGFDAITIFGGDSVIQTCKNNTIDGNPGHGIRVVDVPTLAGLICINNIISNQTVAGKFGITVGAGTTAGNDRTKLIVDYNSFYNNTSNYGTISAGPHDTALVVSPYVNSSIENYTLA